MPPTSTTSETASDFLERFRRSISPKPRLKNPSPPAAKKKFLRPARVSAECGFLKLPLNSLPDLLPLFPPLQPGRQALLRKFPLPEPPALPVRKPRAPATGAENRPAPRIHFPDGMEFPRFAAAPAPGSRPREY